jgi:hypothetical protein
MCGPFGYVYRAQHGRAKEPYGSSARSLCCASSTHSPFRDGYPESLFLFEDKANITYLPIGLLREIFLYSLDTNQMTSGHLASVCLHWRSGITSIASLWSTLRVGTWTEKEQVTTWSQRAYPKKVVIDTQRGGETQSDTPPLDALLYTLTCTGQWHELIISSFPSEDLTSKFKTQVTEPMKVLKVLHVATGCVHSPLLAHLLELVPTEAPLSELGLSPSFASAHFLQPQSVLQILESSFSMEEIFMSHFSFSLPLPSSRFGRLFIFFSHCMALIPTCRFSLPFMG